MSARTILEHDNIVASQTSQTSGIAGASMAATVFLHQQVEVAATDPVTSQISLAVECYARRIARIPAIEKVYAIPIGRLVSVHAIANGISLDERRAIYREQIATRDVFPQFTWEFSVTDRNGQQFDAPQESWYVVALNRTTSM